MAKIIGLKYESATADLSIWGDGTATVMRVYSRYRRLGHATGLMKEVCTYADDMGLTLVLIAWPFKAERNCLTKERLVPFYQKFGFEPGDHDALVGTYMVRQPQE